MQSRDLAERAAGEVKKEEKVKGNPARRAAAAAEYQRLARSGAPPGTRCAASQLSCISRKCTPCRCKIFTSLLHTYQYTNSILTTTL